MTNETRTVQNYRHDARRTLYGAREKLALRTPETQEVYRLINGAVEGIIRGRVGLTQEQQVEHLNRAAETLRENLESLPEKVDAAKESVTALIEDWENSIKAEAQNAIDTLDEAAAYAADRDFEAHQQAKGRYSDEDGDEDEDEDDDED